MMRVHGWIVVLLALAVSVSNAVVHKIAGHNIDFACATNDIVVLNFCTSWSTLCKEIAIEYERASNAQYPLGRVYFGTVDAKAEPKLRNQYNVWSYPHIVARKADGSTIQYKGRVHSLGIISFVKRTAFSSLQPVNTPEQIDEYLHFEDVTILGIFEDDKREYHNYLEITKRLQSKILMGFTTNRTYLQTMYGIEPSPATVIVYKRFENSMTVYKGDFSIKVLANWILENTKLLVNFLHPENAFKYLGFKIPGVLLFLDTLNSSYVATLRQSTLQKTISSGNLMSVTTIQTNLPLPSPVDPSFTPNLHLHAESYVAPDTRNYESHKSESEPDQTTRSHEPTPESLSIPTEKIEPATHPHESGHPTQLHESEHSQTTHSHEPVQPTHSHESEHSSHSHKSDPTNSHESEKAQTAHSHESSPKNQFTPTTTTTTTSTIYMPPHDPIFGIVSEIAEHNVALRSEPPNRECTGEFLTCLAMLHELAPEYKGKLNFIYTDGISFQPFMNRLGLFKLPSVVILDWSQEKHYLLDPTTPITPTTLHSLFSDFFSDNLLHFVRSAPLPTPLSFPSSPSSNRPFPSSQPSPDLSFSSSYPSLVFSEGNATRLVHVVADNFNELVLNTSKYVVLNIHLPWCGYSKSVWPAYEKLASIVLDDHITIADFDASINDMPRDFPPTAWPSHFPHITLFGPHANDPIDMVQELSLENMVEFLLENIPGFVPNVNTYVVQAQD